MLSNETPDFYSSVDMEPREYRVSSALMTGKNELTSSVQVMRFSMPEGFPGGEMVLDRW